MANPADLAATQTDWKRLRSMTDDDIADGVANDPDTAPISTADELASPGAHQALSLPFGGF